LLCVDTITCYYRDFAAVREVSFTVAPGEVVGIVGPNGSGKTTVLRAVTRVHRPRSGRVLLDGQDIYALPARQAALALAVVTQNGHVDFDVSVQELVLMGRHPHLRGLRGEGPDDFRACRRALELTDTAGLGQRLVATLSGGERQRVELARALAQEPRLLVLDEPTAHLDIAYQLEVMELVAALNVREGMTVLMVIHDLNLAARFCHRLILLKEGRVCANGHPEVVLTAPVVEEVYGIRALVGPHPVHSRPHVFPLERRR
jgi:iron complex transport system ATP-binding protein